MTNTEMRNLIKASRLYNYEVARQLGISESTFTHWWREDLTEEQQTRICKAIEELKEAR